MSTTRRVARNTSATTAADRVAPLVALPSLAEDYLAYMRFEKRLAPGTIENYRRDLIDLATFAASASSPQRAVELHALTSNDIRRFVAITHGKGMSPRAIARMLSCWRGYFKFAMRNGVGEANPCDGVRAPKATRPLPNTLSMDAAVHLVSFVDETLAGIRDRAIFELLYSSGLRIAELVGLNLDSIDFAAAEVRVLGKGNKTRIVPVGSHALVAVQRWLDVRNDFPSGEPRALFLGVRGKRVSATVLEARIKHWARVQGIEADVHPHMLRHSFASHLLQSSGNLRAVQEMMGHASIASTQVYTHLDFQHLSKVYDTAHPRARKK